MSNYFKLDNVIKIATWLTTIVLIVIVVIGVYPYTQVLAVLFGKNALVKTISFGYAQTAASWVGILLSWAAGFLFYAVINIIETLPIFLKRDRDVVREMMGQFDTKDIPIDDDDNVHLKAYKKVYNALPALNLRNARIAAIFAYTLDFAVNIVSAPLAKSVDEMFFLITTGQFGRLNQQSFIILGILLFGMEVALKFYLSLSETNKIIQKAKKGKSRQQPG